MKIAVLLTTFNRRDQTVACLESLKNQLGFEDNSLEVFLTDDNSSDGTVPAVLKIFPQANIFQGNGQLFWAGGMRKSWSEALKHQFDFYLLLNDDTLLRQNALEVLLDSYSKIYTSKGLSSIVVGSTSELTDKSISYGGKKLLSSYNIKSKLVYSETELLECDLGNANIMLVPKAVVDKIGILSEVYTHGIADYDYTLQAKKNNFGVYVAPGILGSCTNDHGNNWKSQNSTLSERIKFLKSPKGLAYKEYLYLTKTFFPVSFPETFVKLWMKTLFPVIWDKFKS